MIFLRLGSVTVLIHKPCCVNSLWCKLLLDSMFDLHRYKTVGQGERLLLFLLGCEDVVKTFSLPLILSIDTR
jgi:hypothetical protein